MAHLLLALVVNGDFVRGNLRRYARNTSLCRRLTLSDERPFLRLADEVPGGRIGADFLLGLQPGRELGKGMRWETVGAPPVHRITAGAVPFGEGGRPAELVDDLRGELVAGGHSPHWPKVLARSSVAFVGRTIYCCGP